MQTPPPRGRRNHGGSAGGGGGTNDSMTSASGSGRTRSGVRRPRSEVKAAVVEHLCVYVEQRQHDVDAAKLNSEQGMEETVQGVVGVIQELGGDVESFLAVDLARFPPFFGRAIACKASYQILLQIQREHRAAEELPWLDFCNIRFHGWEKLPAASMASIFPPCQFFYYMLVALNGSTLNQDAIDTCMYTITGNDTDNKQQRLQPAPFCGTGSRALGSPGMSSDGCVHDGATHAGAWDRRYRDQERDCKDQSAAYRRSYHLVENADINNPGNDDEDVHEDIELKGMEPGAAVPRHVRDRCRGRNPGDAKDSAPSSPPAPAAGAGRFAAAEGSAMGVMECATAQGASVAAMSETWAREAASSPSASQESSLGNVLSLASAMRTGTYKDHANELVDQMIGSRKSTSLVHGAAAASVGDLMADFNSMSVDEMVNLVEVNQLLEYDADHASQLAREWDLESGRQSFDGNMLETEAMRENELAAAEDTDEGGCRNVGAAAALADRRGDFPTLFVLALRGFVEFRVDLEDFPEFIVEIVMSYFLETVDMASLDMREWPPGTMLELIRRAPSHVLMDIAHEHRAEREHSWGVFCEVRFGQDYLAAVNPSIAQMFSPCRLFYLLLQREAFGA